MKDFINISKQELKTKKDKKDFITCVAMIPVIGAVLYGSVKFIQWYALVS